MIFLHDLERMAIQGCEAPGCDHKDHLGPVFLHARCHVGGRIEVSFNLGDLFVLVACQECHKPIVKIAVRKKA